MSVKEKLAKLIDVKSIITLVMTIVFAVMASIGVINAEQFIAIYTVVIGFYFGTQYQKGQSTK